MKIENYEILENLHPEIRCRNEDGPFIFVGYDESKLFPLFWEEFYEMDESQLRSYIKFRLSCMETNRDRKWKMVIVQGGFVAAQIVLQAIHFNPWLIPLLAITVFCLGYAIHSYRKVYK